MISRRARDWTSHDPYLVRAHFMCAQDPFDPETNPGGFVNLGTAENHQVFDAIAPLIEEAFEIREKDTHYNELHGALFLREAVAEFLSARSARSLSPDHIVLATGASAILELLSFVLADPGDAILIPAPYYPGFDHDLGLRSGAHLVPVPLRSPDFDLGIDDLERGYAETTSRGMRVAAILLNSPHNPLGRVLGKELTQEVVDFASRRDIHVILDEVYAESLLPGVEHYTGLDLETPFAHVVYGFAKDFGLSGYKAGILHSENPEVLAAAQGLAYFHPVSMLAQRVLAGVIRTPRLREFHATLRERLAASYLRATKELSAHGIPFVPAQGGIVLWLDLSSYLPAASFDGERELAAEILDRQKVNISPGQAFHASEPGWFRLCFTVPEAHLAKGLTRAGRHLGSRE